MTPSLALKAFETAGRAARVRLTHVGSVARLFVILAGRLLALPSHNFQLAVKTTLNQVRFGGLQAVPLVAGLAALIGGVSIIQAFSILSGLADGLIGSLLVGVVLRELAPLVTGVIFIGRSGTAMATELGSMRLNGEVDALAAHRIDPVAYIVLPRVAGAVICMYGLMAVFDLMGVLGGFGVAVLLKDISFPILIGRIAGALSNAELVVFLLKGGSFGLAIGLLSCYFGLRVSFSPTELPRAVTRAVVSSLAAIFALDTLIAVVHYTLL